MLGCGQHDPVPSYSQHGGSWASCPAASTVTLKCPSDSRTTTGGDQLPISPEACGAPRPRPPFTQDGVGHAQDISSGRGGEAARGRHCSLCSLWAQPGSLVTSPHPCPRLPWNSHSTGKPCSFYTRQLKVDLVSVISKPNLTSEIPALKGLSAQRTKTDSKMAQNWWASWRWRCYW